jgi:hypothetical protein
MIVQLFIGLLADLVFDSAASMSRAYRTEMDGFLARRGFTLTRPAKRPTIA